VATSFTFQGHRLGPVVHAGIWLWPGEEALDVSRAFRDLALAAPDGVGLGLLYLTAPPEPFVPENLVGKLAVAVGYVFAGDAEEGSEHARPFRELGPAVDLVGDTGYAEFNGSLDDPPDHYNYWSADYHDELPDAALDIFVESARNLPDATSQQLIARWGGAVGGNAGSATPLINRNAAWVSHPYGISPTPEEGQLAKAWVKDFRAKIAPYANGGVWLNFIGNEGQDRIRAAFGNGNYARLARVKRDFDPQNVFRGNQNILPAGS
jgi:hypothetical protein